MEAQTAAEFDRAVAVQGAMRPPRRTTSTITDVLRRWAAGHDTAAIAAVTGLPEADIARIVAAEQDRRHASSLTARQRASRPAL